MKHRLLKALTLFTAAMLLPVLLNFSGTANAQEIPDLEKANNLFSLGKKYFSTGNYKDAAMTFEIALEENPLNRVTTACLYYGGLAWYKAGEADRGKALFSRLIQNYPLSKYCDDARYHKGLLLLENDDNALRELGLDILLSLGENAGTADMRKLASDAARDFLFNKVNRKFAEVYYLFSAEENKQFVVEAICYHLEKEGKTEQIIPRIDRFVSEKGTPTRYMNLLRRKYSGKSNPSPVSARDELRMVIVLPLHLELVTGTGIPPESARGFELYEGVKIALDSLSPACPFPVRVKVMDSRNDTLNVRHLIPEIEAFGPDIVIGDISTRTSRLIAGWAEENEVLQFVPLNPSNDLIQNRKNIFLTHPSIQSHGSGMAEFAWKNLNAKKIAVFTDGTPIVKEISGSFSSRFKELGGSITLKTVPSKFDAEDKTIENAVLSLKGSGYDAVYIPLANEEVAGMIASRMKISGINIRILGSPDWENFNAIDNDLKNSMKVTWSTFFYERNDSAAAQKFNQDFLHVYGKYPTKYAIQGYDIMRFLLSVCEASANPAGIREGILTHPLLSGIHQNTDYRGKQDNQCITIVQFQNGRVIKVN